MTHDAAIACVGWRYRYWGGRPGFLVGEAHGCDYRRLGRHVVVERPDDGQGMVARADILEHGLIRVTAYRALGRLKECGQVQVRIEDQIEVTEAPVYLA